MMSVATETEIGADFAPATKARSFWVREVSYTFGLGQKEVSNPVLKNNNLELYPGEIVILTGQSGSGKTTLLTLIGGLRRLQKEGGNIQVLGHELAGMSDEDLIRPAPQYRLHLPGSQPVRLAVGGTERPAAASSSATARPPHRRRTPRFSNGPSTC